MLLYLRISNLASYEAAKQFFSSDGDSVHFAQETQDNYNLLQFECDEWRDANDTEFAIQNEWLDYCEANDLDSNFYFDSED